MSKAYYILSKKHTRGNFILFWAPNSCGYTLFLERAGVYSEDDACDATDGFRSDDTFAVPVELVREKAHQAVYVDDLDALAKKRKRPARRKP